MLVGRKKEIDKLNKLCNSEESKLAVIYGRRRIGKTYLINTMFRSHRNCLFFNFTGSYDSDNKEQLANFADAIYYWFKKDVGSFSNWTEAFNKLKRVIEAEKEESSFNYSKTVIFIDEIAWIDKSNKSGFEGALGHFWNTYCQMENDFVVILCSSNASWIKNRILQDGIGPQHQRADEVISMKPFTLNETIEYLKVAKKLDLGMKTATEIYMVFGGVAKYLSFYDKDLSLAKNINKLFFTIGAQLYNEYETLFKSLFIDKDGTYKKVVDELCNKQSGFTTTELAEKLDIPSSSPKLRKTLSDLVECGFIQAVNKMNTLVANVKYIIADPFLLFHNKWVLPVNMNKVSRQKDYWETIMSSQSYPIWAGFSFEMVCITNLEAYLKVRGLGRIFKSASYWNFVPNDKEIDNGAKGAQIDILIECDNDYYEIIECKYYNDEYSISADYKTKLLNKKNMFIQYGIKKKKFDIKTVFISTYGVKENSHYNDIPVSGNYDLDTLFG